MKSYIIYAIIMMLGVGAWVTTPLWYPANRGPWYLGCTDGTTEYMMKVDARPYVKDGVVHIGNDTFVTPKAGMTCRIVRVSEIEKGVDKGIES